jgi:hypothetical protein
MSTTASLWTETGLEVLNLQSDAAFCARRLSTHDTVARMEAMQRLASAFVHHPDRMLQELADAAVELCGADSAGISVERPEGSDQEFYHWVATAGQYNGFLGAILPRYPSACGICLERAEPQHFRVGNRFFDIMGISAPLVSDGILLPWQVDGTRGTIFIMAHDREEAFDMNDCLVMQMLANFAAMSVRQQKQQSELLEQTARAAAVSMANGLAHRINNPLQSLTNVLFLAASGYNGEEAKVVGEQAMADLQRLSDLVQKLLLLSSGAPA